MLVFDPLAISLVIAANFAFEMSRNGDEAKTNKNKQNKQKMEFFKKMWERLFPKREKKVVIETTIEEPKIDKYMDDSSIKNVFVEESNEEKFIDDKSSENIDEESSNEEVKNIETEETKDNFKEDSRAI